MNGWSFRSPLLCVFHFGFVYTNIIIFEGTSSQYKLNPCWALLPLSSDYLDPFCLLFDDCDVRIVAKEFRFFCPSIPLLSMALFVLHFDVSWKLYQSIEIEVSMTWKVFPFMLRKEIFRICALLHLLSEPSSFTFCCHLFRLKKKKKHISLLFFPSSSFLFAWTTPVFVSWRNSFQCFHITVRWTFVLLIFK